ncbi:MAG: hypothetical protein EXR75_02440 [Myxococcales bacterium]|nr:hypothetical protein [Myxococcales bacterium]
MLNFEPSEEQRLMRDSVAELAKAVLFPAARRHEAARRVAAEVRAAASELGLGTVLVPEHCGGSGLGLTTAVLLEEELGRADAGAAFGLPGPGAFGLALCELSTADQLVEWLGPFTAPDALDRYGAVAWSEAGPNRERAGFSTVARCVKDDQGDTNWELTGEKCFIANAEHADRFVVFAQLDEALGWRGIGAFVVRRDNPGLSFTARHATLGLEAASFGAIKLESARVMPSAHLDKPEFLLATLRFFSKYALVVTARALGLAHTAFELARQYCDTRVAFGKPIGHFQAVAFNLADRLMDLESARWLLWRAAWSWDVAKPDGACLLASAQAAAQIHEIAMRCADDCVSLHGGAGFVRDVLAEKLMRDAKQLSLCGPTVATLDQLASALELGGDLGALDPGLVLPTPDTQAIFT